VSEAVKDRCSLPGCAAWFPGAPGQLYCSPAHGKAAARHADRLGVKMPALAARIVAGECLRPDKRVFPDFVTAQAEADLMGGERRGIGPYRCSCSKIHIGHAPGAKQARLDYLEDLQWMREFAWDDDPMWAQYPEGRYGPVEKWRMP
jgi:hypothetical protein